MSPCISISRRACEHGGVTRPDTRTLWNANAAAWTELSRAGFDRYRDLVNAPAFFELLPPVDRLACLDLGCGEGHNARLLASKGACVAALDVAESFITAAARESRHGICYVVGDGAALPFGASVFDVVTAFMSLMDVAEPERTLDAVARVLRPGGFVQFSVLHPVTSAPIGRWLNDESGARQARAIGDYLYQGPLTEKELQRRTGRTEGPVRAIRDYLRSPEPGRMAQRRLQRRPGHRGGQGTLADEQTATRHPEVADTRIVPYFLIVRARKP
jgi:2-polyprenyl-3-methyl-5-hydroxy-6-metoxy-1,4-benzoquinol methylase